ncbi:phosphatidylinositol synthase [Mycena floridula]|nr:phosphatidylinositol synthase [Mycena floridula]
MSQNRHTQRESISLVDAKEAVDLATKQTYSENVFLFAPNLIGYTRIILAGLSMHFMSYHPKYCTIAYCISCLLDAVDGQVARALGQTSKFGAVLDMVTDRCTTSCLLCYLSAAYPSFALFFQFLIALDFSSHYMHMYSSLVTGSVSHKLVRSDVSRIMWLYYNDSRTLFTVCAGNELFFVGLYLMKWVHTPIGLPLINIDAIPPFISKWIIGLSYPQLLTLLCCPIFAFKNAVNFVQLWKASKILVGVDLAERAKARREKLLEKQE